MVSPPSEGSPVGGTRFAVHALGVAAYEVAEGLKLALVAAAGAAEDEVASQRETLAAGQRAIQ